MQPCLFWFRRDLRLQDNPAFAAAVARGPVIPVYILDDRRDGDWPIGAASRWWLHHSLAALDKSLRASGTRLILSRGDSEAELTRMIAECGADAVYWSRCYEPEGIAYDTKLKLMLRERGTSVQSFPGSVLFEPHEVQKKSGGPFQVFTPFWRQCLQMDVAPPVTMDTRSIVAPETFPESASIDEMELLPRIRWDAEFASQWRPGELGAQAALTSFLEDSISDYTDSRNRPDMRGTSGLSPHLHFGEVSPRQVWAAVNEVAWNSGVHPPSGGAETFLREIGWREFACHLLYHFPHTSNAPLRGDFDRFPWVHSAELLTRWQRGETGYPIVDAGMRQLWRTGWMHNRVRMIVASFLVKHLRISWLEGARWFWDTLVDADLASNTLGWQWSAGCGADAAPYFRIFNPVLQGEKYDPDGVYVRRWVPELAALPNGVIHKPWTATPLELSSAGVVLGENYPAPIVEHAAARAAALDAFGVVRGGGTKR